MFKILDYVFDKFGPSGGAALVVLIPFAIAYGLVCANNDNLNATKCEKIGGVYVSSVCFDESVTISLDGNLGD